jgi:hypothetical protein
MICADTDERYGQRAAAQYVSFVLCVQEIVMMEHDVALSTSLVFKHRNDLVL